MEKPTKVEVGQRWESPNGAEVREVERIDGNRAYFTIGSLARDASWQPLYDAWVAGARDFPRSHALSPTAATAGEVGANGGVNGILPRKEPMTIKEADDAVISRQRAEIATLRAEVAALREPFRRKPKPEPWVPSVDEVDLLPDAGR